jgi:hypothetical protein
VILAADNLCWIDPPPFVRGGIGLALFTGRVVDPFGAFSRRIPHLAD